MSKIQKLPYQLEAVRQMDHFKGRVLLADEMGVGKTVETLLWLKKHPKIKPVIIVCPASLKWLWSSFIKRVLKKGSTVLSGQVPPKKGLTKNQSIIIINYDILQYWLDYLQEIQPKLIILDECQYIKNKRAIRSKSIKILAGKIKYKIAISGTPLTNRPAELWLVLNLLRPDIFNSFRAYADRHCQPKMKPWGWEYKGAQNLKELHRKLKRTMMIRRLKKDVLEELPEKSRYIIPMDIRDRQEYDEAVSNFNRWLSKKSIIKTKQAEKAKQLVKMGYIKRLAAIDKMENVIDWIDSFLESSSGKIVLFATHKSIIETLHNKYQKKCVVIDGSTPVHKRSLIVKSFQTNKRIRIFIGNIKAAGEGITLTAASTLAFVELDWVPSNHTQAEDRIHRIGQKNAVEIYYLVAKDTIEENLCRLIQKKQKIVAATLDGSSRVNQLDIFDELEKSLRKGTKK